MRNATFLDEDAVRAIGFAAVGAGVLIHPSCVFVGVEAIHIGDDVRIDPYCVVTARVSVTFGTGAHVASHCSLVGAAGISIGKFASVSHGVRLFSESDDLAASALIGSQAPRAMRAIQSGRVSIGDHACIGASSVVLPGVCVGHGATLGALSLAKKDLEPWSVNAGCPARRIGMRDRAAVLALAARNAG